MNLPEGFTPEILTRDEKLMYAYASDISDAIWCAVDAIDDLTEAVKAGLGGATYPSPLEDDGK